MTCRLCLSGAEILIPVYDASGADAKGMAATIAKFTGVQLSGSHDSKICVSCWASVDNFQKFCALVAQRQEELRKQLQHSQENAQEKPQLFEVVETYEAHFGRFISLEKSDESEAGTAAKDMLYFEAEEEQIVKIEKETIEVTEVTCLEKKDVEIVVLNELQECAEEKASAESIPKKALISKLASKLPKETTLPKSSRPTNARKIGRPAKNDAAACLADDRLIASHMQLTCDVCQACAKDFHDLMQHFKVAHQATGYAVCCRKRLYKRGLLIDHINVHKDPEYFKCEHCAHIFADRVCLRNHILLKHRSAAELCFQCEHCGKKFAKAYLLQRHVIMHMPGEQRTHRCESCNKAYPSLSRLRAHHKNVHGDGSLRVCNHCGKCIRGKSTFERHIEQHERPGDVSQRGVQCTVCGDWLSDRYCLRVHMERHEQQRRSFACVLCGKTAPSRLAMNAHYRYHHGTQPEHKCEHCERSFRTQRGLREHVTTHTGETLYACTYCDKKFKCSSNLHAHRKWQHPVEWARDRQAPKVIKPA